MADRRVQAPEGCGTSYGLEREAKVIPHGDWGTLSPRDQTVKVQSDPLTTLQTLLPGKQQPHHLREIIDVYLEGIKLVVQAPQTGRVMPHCPATVRSEQQDKWEPTYHHSTDRESVPDKITNLVLRRQGVL